MGSHWAHFFTSMNNFYVLLTVHPYINIPPCIPDSHPHRITSTKCRINTVVPPDDGHIVAPKHVEKRNKHTKKNCAPSWLYLQNLSINLIQGPFFFADLPTNGDQWWNKWRPVENKWRPVVNNRDVFFWENFYVFSTSFSKEKGTQPTLRRSKSFSWVTISKWIHGRDSNQVRPLYKPAALPLYQALSFLLMF